MPGPRAAQLGVGALQRLAVVSGIDLKAVANTTLYTVPTGKTAYAIGALVECEAAVAIVTPATAGIGIAAGEDDIFAAVALTGLDAAGKTYGFLVAGLSSRTAPAGSAIKLGVDTGAVGTSQTAKVHLLGFLA